MYVWLSTNLHCHVLHRGVIAVLTAKFILPFLFNSVEQGMRARLEVGEEEVGHKFGITYATGYFHDGILNRYFCGTKNEIVN